MAGNIKGITIEIGGNTQPLEKALGDVNKKTRDLQGELKSVERLLKLDPGNTELLAQKQKLLAEQVGNSTEKLNRLKAAQEQVNQAFQRGDLGEEQYRHFQRQVINAEQDLKKFETQLKDVDSAAKKSGLNVKEMGDKLKGVGQSLTLGVTTPIVGGFLAITEGTKELRGDLATLATNANVAGQDMGILNDAMVKLQAVTGETDSNVEGLSELLATGFRDEQLSELLDSLYGASIKFKDTLKFEGIADGLQETLATGAAIGPFGELLERSGIQLDGFNKGLKDAIKNGTEEQYILDVLAKTGLAETYEAYRKNNEEMVKAEEASFRMQQAMAKLGATLEPILTPLIEGVTSLVNKFNELDPAGQKTVITIAGIAAAIGPLLVLFGGAAGAITTISGGISALSVTLGGATIASGGFAAAAGTIVGSLLPIIATVATVGLVMNEFCDYLGKAGEKADIFGPNVSDATKQAVDAFMDLDIKARAALDALALSGDKVTKDMAGKMTQNIEAMVQQVIQGLESKKGSMRNAILELFNQDGVIDKNEEKDLKAIDDYYRQQEDAVKKAQERYKQIVDKAKEENRSLTSSELGELAGLQETIKNQGIDALSQYETEAAAIKERIKASSLELSAQELSQIVKSANEQRDAAVNAAKDKAEQVIQFAKFQRDVKGTISEEEYQQIVDNATRQCDESIAKANETRDGVVSAAQQQAGEHAEAVDKETGDVLSGWDIFVNRMKKIPDLIGGFLDLMKSKYQTFKNEVTLEIKGLEIDLDKSWEAMKKGASDKWAAMVKSVKDAWNDVKRDTQTKWDEIKTEALGKWDSLKTEAGTKWDGIKTTIQGKVQELKTELDGIIGKIVSAFDSMQINIPTPRLPKIGWTWKNVSFAGTDINIPDLYWYKKGGIFDQPSIIGVGEAGTEIVAPVDKLPGLIADALRQALGVQQTPAATATGAAPLQPIELVVNLDGRVIAQGLYNVQQGTARGKGMR